jgi:hypothetical protein
MSVSADDRADLLDRLNYFNYFTEVEEEFVRRRGSPMLISPMDWALVESWKNAGIPLHVVLRGISRSFDLYETRGRKHRKVNSVFYCQQEVEAAFAEYRLSQVGAAETKPADNSTNRRRKLASSKQCDPFSKDALIEFITRCHDQIAQLQRERDPGAVTDALSRASRRLVEIKHSIETTLQIDAESLERDLDAIDRMILQALRAELGEDRIETIRAEAKLQLQPYRKKMDRAIYEQTIENFIARQLREMYQIPRLSLFYL